MAFFGLKLGLDLEMRAAHPTKNSKEYPPPEYITLITLVHRVFASLHGTFHHQSQSLYQLGQLPCQPFEPGCSY